MIELLARLLAHAVDRVRMNRLHREEHRWIKRRCFYAPLVIALGNFYLARSLSGIRMHARARVWAHFEMMRWRALHGPRAAGEAGPGAIWTRVKPGESLTAILAREGDSSFARAAMQAGGAELRRAHDVVIDGQPFSHGDLHLSNLLYANGRAHIIDFETPHDPSIVPEERHADDLYVLLLDLIAKVPQPRNLASAFFDGYANERVFQCLAGRLLIEKALLPRSLQIVRSGFISRSELEAAFREIESRSLPPSWP